MPMYARGCDGVIIVCDVSNPDTIESISKWKSVADTTLADFKPSILLVNKVHTIELFINLSVCLFVCPRLYAHLSGYHQKI